MWDLPRPGPEPMSPALAGRFSTAAPPGKPSAAFLTISFYQIPETKNMENKYAKITIQISGKENRLKGEINPTNIKTYYKTYIKCSNGT